MRHIHIWQSDGSFLDFLHSLGDWARESRSKQLTCFVKPSVVVIDIKVERWGEHITVILKMVTVDGAVPEHPAASLEERIEECNSAALAQSVSAAFGTLLDRFGLSGRIVPVTEEFARSHRRLRELRERIERRIACSH